MEDNFNDYDKKYETNPKTNDDTGIEYAKINDYSIRQFENVNGNSYFLAIPLEHVDNYQLFVGFPKKDLHYMSKKDIVAEVNDIKKMLDAVNKNNIYMLPDIPVNELEEAANENDSKKFSKILNNRVQPMIADANRILKDYDTAEKTIDQVIMFVKQTEHDVKFVDWLEINLPNFIHGITYDKLKQYYYEMVSKEQVPTNYTPQEEIFQSTTIAHQKENETLVKSNVKKRVLTRDDMGHYGFSNIVSTLIILGAIIASGIIIKLFLFN